MDLDAEVSHQAEDIKLQPFGSGPWPCLNVVCDHYSKEIIQDYDLSFTQQKPKRIRGTFTCPICGFSYSLLERDRRAWDDLHRKTIESYGPMWDNRLRDLGSDSSTSLNEKGRLLGVDSVTVLSQAERLGLSFPPAGSTTAKHPAKPRQRDPRNKYRRQWIAAIESLPSASLTQLKKVTPVARRWLAENDKEWFDDHKPSPKCTTPHKLDWTKLDKDLAAKICAAGEARKQNPGYTERITKSRLCKDIRLSANFLSKDNLEKLHMVDQTLKDYVESQEQFAVRPINFAAEQHRARRVLPTLV